MTIIPVIRPQDLNELAPVAFGYVPTWPTYIRELDRRCRDETVRGPVHVVIVSSDDYLAWCAANAVTPQGQAGLQLYATGQARIGDFIEYESDLTALIQAHDVDRMTDHVLVKALDSNDIADVKADIAEKAYEFVDQVSELIPLQGHIRVVQLGTYWSGAHDRTFELSSAAEEDSEAFPGDLRTLLFAEVTLCLATGGTVAVECDVGGEWKFMMWTLDSGELVPLEASRARAIATEWPHLIPEDLAPADSVDASFDSGDEPFDSGTDG